MTRQHTVVVDILGKEYQVACPPEEAEALRRAADYLDQQMRDIRASGKIIGLERVAIMAALNISYDYLASQTGNSASAGRTLDDDDRLKALNSRLDDALFQLRQLEIGG